MNYNQPYPQQPYPQQPYPQQPMQLRQQMRSNNYPVQKQKSSKGKIIVGIIVFILVFGALGSWGKKKSGDSDQYGTKASTDNTNNVASVENEETKSAPTEETTEAAIAEVTVEEQVIYDENDIKITVTGLKDAMFGTELKLAIENNTDKSVMIQCRDANVNGYMVTTMFSVDIAAGKKVNDGITFETSGLKECGIENIATMEFKIVVIDGESWDEIVKSDVIKVDTSIADEYVQNYDDSGKVLVDTNGIKIIEKGLSEDDSFWGPGVILYIENNSDQDITIQTRDVSVNGYMVDSIMSEDVVVGKKAISDVQFFSTDLEENGIDEIKDVELYFHIFSWDTMDTICDSDIIKLSY